MMSMFCAQLYGEYQFLSMFPGMLQEVCTKGCDVLSTAEAFSKDTDLAEDLFEMA